MFRLLIFNLFLVSYVISAPCVDNALGLAKKIIPDYKLTATSSYSEDTSAKFARLKSRKSWCSSRYPTKGKEYVQVDLGAPHLLCAIATQGNPAESIWVRKYKMQVSTDGLRWEYYKELADEKVFVANKNSNGVVKNVLRTRLKAMFVRIFPVDYNAGSRFCMRLEIYGHRPEVEKCQTPIHLEEDYPHGSVKRIPDAYMTASSRFNFILAARKGRLYGKFAWCADQTATKDPSLSLKQYLQIEFGEVLAVSGIAIQGEASYRNRVSAYYLNYSIDNRTWWTYQEGGMNKILQGPEAVGQIAVSWLKRPILARVISINPQLWNNDLVCLRVEVYGCQPQKFGGIISPKVISHPSDGIKVEGEASFTCKAAGVPPPNIQWQWKDSAIPGRIVMSGIMAVSKLDVYPLKRADSGLMSCLATNGIGQVDQVQFKVNVHYPPEINRDLSTKFVHATIGDHVVFTCEATGNPAPVIEWTTPHRQKTNTSHVTTGKILVITSVQSTDLGVYVCKASNYLGQDERSVKLRGAIAESERRPMVKNNAVPSFALIAICILATLLVILAIAHVFVFFRVRSRNRKKTPTAVTNQVYHSVCCSKARSQEAQAQNVEMVPAQAERPRAPALGRPAANSHASIPSVRSSREIAQHQIPQPARNHASSRAEVEPYEIQTLHDNRRSHNAPDLRDNVHALNHGDRARASSVGYEVPSSVGYEVPVDSHHPRLPAAEGYDVIFPLRNGAAENSSYMSLSDKARDRNSTSSDHNYQSLVQKKAQATRH